MTKEKSKIDLMREIRTEVAEAKDSPLYEYRTENNYFPVIGQGSHNANIMFIGEAPGKNEAEKGIPFCGAAGKFLDALLESINLDREAVYVTNIVKDRPPGNRDPLPQEIEFYSSFLDRQIDIIQPRVIATLGRFSMTYLLNKFDHGMKGGSISELHGKELNIETSYGSISFLPLYHPAAALYNGSMRDTLLEDFKILKKYT